MSKGFFFPAGIFFSLFVCCKNKKLRCERRNEVWFGFQVSSFMSALYVEHVGNFFQWVTHRGKTCMQFRTSSEVRIEAKRKGLMKKITVRSKKSQLRENFRKIFKEVVNQKIMQKKFESFKNILKSLKAGILGIKNILQKIPKKFLC